jgi:glycosyltransferase involved in cell wall biosynthesis
MRSVLLVSYAFPPQYDVSARRAAKLSKYLPAAGWRPVVLTKEWTHNVASEDRQAYAVTWYPEALDELHDVRVVRTGYQTRDNALRRLHARLGGAYAPREVADSPSSRESWTPRALTRRGLSFFSPLFGDFPDAFIGWRATAVPAGVEAVRRESIDAICSLCPPATAHVVASEIAAHTGVPWVAQFDDLFSFQLEAERRAAWRWFGAAKHRGWMRRARGVGAITPGMLEYVRRTYGVDGGVVMVGFDPSDSQTALAPRPDHQRLRLVYTGSVYLDNQRPEILFAALDHLLGARPEAERWIEVIFAGTRCDDELRRRLTAFPNAATVCRFIERVAPTEARELQREADGLVLFNYTAAASETGTLSFPAKAFEYLAAGRPILAVPRDPGGWGDTLLSSTRAGVVADTVDEVADVLAGWLRTWQATRELPYDADQSAIERYAQPRQAATLAALLDRAVEDAAAMR